MSREKQIRNEIKRLQQELRLLNTEEIIMDRILEDHVVRISDLIEEKFESGTKTGCKSVVKYRLKATRKGREIKCEIISINTGKVIASGTSRCHEDDVFDDRLGFQIAQMRAKKDWYEKSERYFLSIHNMI